MNSCSSQTLMSSLFSTISLGSWVCAQLPQIYTNYKNKSAEGISPSFLLLWFMGDFLSFTSCLFNDVVLRFQIWLSVFFLCNDITLCGQYYYYNSVYPAKYGGVTYESLHVSSDPRNSDDIPDGKYAAYTPGESSIHNDFTNSIHIRQSHHPQGNNPMTSSSPLTPPKGSPNAANYSSISAAGTLSSTGPIHSAVKAFAAGSVFNAVSTNAMHITQDMGSNPAPHENNFELLGFVLAWGCTFVYMGSRCPQLYKNYVRKSVDGISPLLFGAALLGNLNYTFSILTSCDFLYGDAPGAFLMKELPYILGSAGTIVFDIAYFYQRHIYRDAGKNTSVINLEAWEGHSVI